MKKKKSPTSNKTKKKQTKTSKKKSNKNIKDANIRDGNMPPYLVREVDTLDTTEFEVVLGFWMTHFNFTGLSTMPAAYDESRYPDPEVKHYVRRNKQYEATQKIRGARKQLLDLCKHATKLIGEINKRESTDLSTHQPNQKPNRKKKKKQDVRQCQPSYTT
jgi:hypothetical protein